MRHEQRGHDIPSKPPATGSSRGVSREPAKVHLWLRDIAPSTELRTWYGHQRERWPEFRERCAAELLGALGQLLDMLLDLEQHRGAVTLTYGARDDDHNEAVVLAEILADRRPRALLTEQLEPD